MWVWIQQLPGLQRDMKRGGGAVPRIQKRGSRGVRCSHTHVIAEPGRVSSLSPLCRSYETMLDSFLVFSHLLVRFTAEKQITNNNGDFCVKQEKIPCPKTWTKQTAFCFSKYPSTLLPFSAAAIHFLPVLPPHPTSTPYKLSCNHHCLSRSGV